MTDQFSRTRLLLGEEGMKRLSSARVAVFGLGGVGGYTVEALARSGVGALDLIDDDQVCLTNLNRQILATRGTIGEYKTDAARERVLSINPDAQVRVYRTFYGPETEGEFDFSSYDYVVDAIDTVTGKIELVLQAERSGTPIISCMGAGNKLDASAFEVADIYETSVCPLAHVMQRELKKRSVRKLKVVYSKEPPITPIAESVVGEDADGCQADGEHAQRRQTPGSTAFGPAVAGLILAGEVVLDLIKEPLDNVYSTELEGL
ncbi:MAG: tRNA threonylcarbamoyladenosine dehydratase [Lachnospiraceae bacterium]|nr:tRNA threonylcarbamoyladenosine dehydratase [Lachnospiraceae bacterium]